MNKSQLIEIAKNYVSNTPYGTMDFCGQEVVVLPTVFPPDLNTPILAEVIEKLARNFLQINNRCRIFEMGTGTGAAILNAAKIPGVIASASDIAPMAVLNAKANALWWNVQCDIYQGNLFENVPQEKFDIIFWNIPFIKDDPGGIEDIRFRIAFDPAYKHFQQFLVDVDSRLENNGQILLAVDYGMCDVPEIYDLTDKAGFNTKVYQESQISWKQIEFHLAFLLLSRK